MSVKVALERVFLALVLAGLCLGAAKLRADGDRDRHHDHDEELFGLKGADALFDAGDYQKALKDYKEILERVHGIKFVTIVEFKIAETYYQLGLADQAIREYQKVIQSVPHGQWARNIKAQSMYKLVLIYFSLQQYPSAVAEAKQLNAEFPQSNLATAADAYGAYSAIQIGDTTTAQPLGHDYVLNYNSLFPIERLP